MNNTTGRSGLSVILPVLALAAAWGYLYGTACLDMIRAWHVGDMPYQYLAPLAAAYLAARNKGSGRPDPDFLSALAAFGLLGGSAWLFVHGRDVGQAITTYLALWLSLPGLALLYGGFGSMSRLGLPLLVLLFAVPVPADLAGAMHGSLLERTSDFGVGLLRLTFVPARLVAGTIDLGFTRLPGAEAGDAMRYAAPALILGTVISLTCTRILWKRLLLILVPVPLLVLLSAGRLWLAGTLGHYLRPAWLEWIFAWLPAFVLFLAAILGVRLLVFVLKPFGMPSSREVLIRDLGRGARYGHSGGLGGQEARLWPQALLAAGILAFAAFYPSHLRDMPEPPRQLLASLPEQVGDWTRSRGPDRLGGPGDAVSAEYQNGVTGRSVRLAVDYRGRWPGAIALGIPSKPLAGQGTLQEQGVAIGDFPADRLLFASTAGRNLENFWFSGRGAATARVWQNRVTTLLDSLVRRRADGALVRIGTHLEEGEAEAQAVLDSFRDSLLSILPAFVPN